ncbi:tyrosine-type recombinase/integrase [Alteribacter populi]|uniref:tyrosine-type recombinase/integrase n=1 Tax=Alteribacter populi TaxID=2011011 RepID=UPI000BBA4867
MRHTYATLGLSNGVSLKMVSELLGHSTISITADIYGHILDDAKRNASNEIFNSIFDNTLNQSIK